MPDYVDDSTQTNIKGLVQHPMEPPPELAPQSVSSTLPPVAQDKEDVKGEALAEDMATNSSSHGEKSSDISPTQQLQRKKRPSFNARISLPSPNLDPEGPPSPPPTHMPQSPLPAANRLHAGHTPIVPRSRSPLRELEPERVESGHVTPEQDQALTGALTLPANPGDATDDRIEVKALDAELEKIAKERQQETGTSPGDNPEHDGQNSRHDSADTGRRPSADEVEEIDGVILKKNCRLNMGAPLGQV
ncbi:hypothetical protein B0J11DRAFT_92608 [Dendryphion nanum]|uniref:Uncharacterized protein n=1 Tax=Dendryphion nanum TaxID=256645 RepID=A0A9P9DF45_9PLEO|nr:hypothetical protein B0J11DRAFT_92608 [Dendryphion nanum]